MLESEVWEKSELIMARPCREGMEKNKISAGRPASGACWMLWSEGSGFGQAEVAPVFQFRSEKKNPLLKRGLAYVFLERMSSTSHAALGSAAAGICHNRASVAASASDVRADENVHSEAGLTVRPLGFASLSNTPRIGLAGS